MDDSRPEPIKITENTYIIGPKETEKFQPSKVRRCVQDVLSKKLNSISYDSRTASDLSRQLSDDIREKVKGLGFKRYKIVVHISLGEIRGQGVKVASRCLWDAQTDNYCTETFQNGSIYCVALVFGTYYE
eukprot:EC122443.1.p1 GENE.EC122443.1~~EC122443.1.p1  ORF type:complete len:130 (+),score=3.91 EC122443.1:150-539(+)